MLLKEPSFYIKKVLPKKHRGRIIYWGTVIQITWGKRLAFWFGLGFWFWPSQMEYIVSCHSWLTYITITIPSWWLYQFSGAISFSPGNHTISASASPQILTRVLIKAPPTAEKSFHWSLPPSFLLRGVNFECFFDVTGVLLCLLTDH